jgi:hypothetical protein
MSAMMQDEKRGTAPESDAALQAFLADPAWVHFAAHMERPGLQGCMEELEWTHYPPDTPAGDQFQLRVLQWSGLWWALISIPIGDKHLMDAVAARHGLRAGEGTIISAGPDGVFRFPARGDRVFSLQSAQTIADLQATILFADKIADALPEPKRTAYRRALRHGRAAREVLEAADLDRVRATLERLQGMGEAG